MDPLGFGLENFDAVGGWRVKEGKSPIDASGTLPDGKTFNGPGRARRRSCDRNSDAFVQGLSEKMLTYALGRGVRDRPIGRPSGRSPRASTPAQYRFSSVVLEIVKSLPFQMRKADKGRI